MRSPTFIYLSLRFGFSCFIWPMTTCDGREWVLNFLGPNFVVCVTLSSQPKRWQCDAAEPCTPKSSRWREDEPVRIFLTQKQFLGVEGSGTRCSDATLRKTPTQKRRLKNDSKNGNSKNDNSKTPRILTQKWQLNKQQLKKRQLKKTAIKKNDNSNNDNSKKRQLKQWQLKKWQLKNDNSKNDN
jgi:hypothetical protein